MQSGRGGITSADQPADRSPSTTTGDRSDLARDPWLDNAKMALVTLVVVGHAVELIQDTYLGQWFYNFLYFWHLPAFVLVSGYLSAGFGWDRRHLMGVGTRLVVPYLLFEPALYWYRRMLGLEPQGPVWLVPHWAMWFLPALAMWRLLAPLLRRSWVLLPLAVLASLVAGLWPWDVLALSRVVGLLPFFAVGLLLARPGLGIAWLRTWWVRITAIGVLLGICWLARSTDDWARTAFFYYDVSYQDLGWAPLPAMWIRLVVMTVGLVGALAVLALMPTRRSWFSAMGAATMVVYLWHGFVVQPLGVTSWPSWAMAHPAIGLVLTILGAVGLALTLACPPVRHRLTWTVDPITNWKRAWSIRRTAPARPAPESAGRPSATLVLPGRGQRR